jgi:SNF2 family DNA or RNA helicase
VEHEFNVWIEGRWIYYAPTVFPSHEAKERGGRWEKAKQAWRIPKLTREAKWIAEYDQEARFSADAERILRQDWEQRDYQVMLSLCDGDEPDGHYKSLYPYQKRGVSALVTRPYHGTLLTLSPGLGKTPTSIVAADLFMAEKGESQRCLIVAPLSLVHNWEREIERWSADPRVEVVHQEAPAPDRSVRWTVTNYDSLFERIKDPNTNRTTVSGNLKEDFDLDWDVVIFDESVLLKNRKSKRAQVCRTLAHRAKRVWLLSGAPITHDNSDAWQQFNLVEPDYFTAFWRFAKEFCVVVKTPWSQGEIQGSRRGMHMRREFPDLMFVRNQEEVFDDLPTYIHQDIELDLHPKQKKAHDDVLDLWIHELQENRDKRVEVTAVIAMLSRLQQITSNLYNLETTGTSWPDYSSKADFVEELLDTGEVEWPVIIWVHHRPGAEALLERLRKRATKKDSALYKRRIEKVVGGTKGADDIIEAFKRDEVDVMLLGITVGKYGHTLANARTIITYDKTWDSDAWFQMLHRAAGARAKLAGYHHRPLLINPRCRNTVDDFVELNLAGKLPAMADMTGADLVKILRSLGSDHIPS